MGYEIPGLGKSATAIPIFSHARNLGVVVLVAGNITKSLPKATDSEGVFLIFKKTDSNATTVTIDPYGSETVDGLTTITLTEQYEVLRLYCNKAAWHMV